MIEVLSQSGSCSLTELRQKTGLDNAGLLRILGTMIGRGWVRQLIVEKRYELSHSLGDILGAEARAHPMAEIAVPILLELRQNPYSLPSDLCAIRGFGQFEIIESTRLRGPMAPGRTGLGLQPSLFQSAHGRVIDFSNCARCANRSGCAISLLQSFVKRVRDSAWSILHQLRCHRTGTAKCPFAGICHAYF